MKITDLLKRITSSGDDEEEDTPGIVGMLQRLEQQELESPHDLEFAVTNNSRSIHVDKGLDESDISSSLVTYTTNGQVSKYSTFQNDCFVSGKFRMNNNSDGFFVKKNLTHFFLFFSSEKIEFPLFCVFHKNSVGIIVHS